MSTTLAKAGKVERKWYVIDAAGKPLGRVAATAAVLLRGQKQGHLHPECRLRRPCRDYQHG